MTPEIPTPHAWGHVLTVLALIGVVGRILIDPNLLRLIATYVSIVAGIASIIWTLTQVRKAKKPNE